MSITTARPVDGGTVQTLTESYGQLVKAGDGSVRAAWRFGQCLDSFSDAYTQLDLADAMGLSTGTLRRYRRLYHAYQRPELAEAASHALETFNVDLLVELQDQLNPVRHQTNRGKRFRYRCDHCHGTEVTREQITDPAELAELEAAR